ALGAVLKYWPALEPLIADAHPQTDWYEALSSIVNESGAESTMLEAEYQQAAAKQLAGPVFGDLGPTRIVDFAALGVRWIFTYDGDRSTVLAAEGLVAAFQVPARQHRHSSPGRHQEHSPREHHDRQ